MMDMSLEDLDVKENRGQGQREGHKEGKDWEEEDGIIMWEGWISVPKDKDLRDEVIHLHHDTCGGKSRKA